MKSRFTYAPAMARPASNAAAVAITVVAVALGITFAYAGPSAAAAGYRLIIDGAALLAWAASGAGLGGIILFPLARSRRAASAAVTLLDVVTATALGLGIESLAILGLGLAGLLNRVIAFALVIVGLVCAGIVFTQVSLRRQAGGPSSESPKSPARTLESSDDHGHSPRWNWAWILVSPFLGLAITASLVTPGLLWKPDEPHGYDAVEYHLQIPREWHEAGRIIPLEHNVFSYFPFNVEMHYLLAMHLRGGPYDGMYLAQMMHVTLTLLALAAACGFALRIAPSRSSALIASLLACTVPWLAQLAPIAFNEGGFLLHGTLAIGWALLGLRDAAHHPRAFILAGAFAGLACGCKLTAVPEILLGVPAVGAVLLLIRRRRMTADATPPTPFVHEMLALAGFTLAGLLVFSPWLLRNVAWAGNPVFPEAPGLFGKGHFSDVQVERWRRAHAPQPANQSPAARIEEFARQVILNWQFGYLLLPLGLAGLILARRDPAAWFLGGLLLLLLVVWLGFTHLQGRFFILAVPLCALLIALAPWECLLPRSAMAPLLAIIVIAAGLGFRQLHARLAAKLYGGPNPNAGLVAALAGPWNGATNISWMTDAALEGLPPDATLVLVGDAQAFWYPIPMTRLRYRTIFDADTSGERGIPDAYYATSGDPELGWALIDPAELERFRRYYQPFPPPPAAWSARPEWEVKRPFLLKLPEPATPPLPR